MRHVGRSREYKSYYFGTIGTLMIAVGGVTADLHGQ